LNDRFGELPLQSTGRALVIHPVLRAEGQGARDPEACLSEAVGLATAIHLTVSHAEVVRVGRPQSSTLLRRGALDRFKDLVAAEEIGLAIVDTRLSPVQQRNLERAWACKVIDRTGLILEIFGERARTREGSLQVELAALTYQRSRLVRSWTHLERQRGGYGFLGGPGESQIESDRRHISERITRIKRELDRVKRTRALHRKARRRVPYPVVALVGYTNAGKSTLFNRLTGARVFADDLLFATLDPTMRVVELPSGKAAILSDTVGFISDLPTDLVAAFRATLEEVREADVIVHVRDISHPDSEAQKRDVEKILEKLGLGVTVEAGLVEALNKIDLVGGEARRKLFNQAARNPDAVPVSAATGERCDRLLARLDQRFVDGREVVEIVVDLRDGAAIAWLYDHGAVLARHDDSEFAHIRIDLSPANIARFERRQVQRAS
jgi:GTP-binding protein HflX